MSTIGYGGVSRVVLRSNGDEAAMPLPQRQLGTLQLVEYVECAPMQAAG